MASLLSRLQFFSRQYYQVVEEMVMALSGDDSEVVSQAMGQQLLPVLQVQCSRGGGGCSTSGVVGKCGRVGRVRTGALPALGAGIMSESLPISLHAHPSPGMGRQGRRCRDLAAA